MTKHMAKRLLALAALIYIVPAVASAAWWNPLTWRVPAKAAAPVGISGSRVAPATTTPTIEELQARIVELQNALAAALSRAEGPAAKTVAPAASTPAASAAPQSSSATDSLVKAQVAPAVVFLETATSSGAGAFIDSQGHILTPAHTIWIQDSTNAVIGFADTVTVTLSNGTKKLAKVIGMDQANDIAIVQTNDKTSSSYIKTSSASTATVGDRAYVLSFPVSKVDSTLGNGFVAGTVSRKSSAAVDATVDTKPLDNGGAMIDSKATLIGIPRIASCKILEEMSHCLKYVVTANNIRVQLPKLIAGMKLYITKKNETYEENLIRGSLDGMYQSVFESGALDYAVRNVTGQNNFDLFNGRLSDDQDGKMTRIYLNKLKLSAESAYQAVDFLKNQSYNLDIFLKGEESSRSALDGYQAMIITQLQADNAAKEKEYETKVDYWSKKKKEYDAKLGDISNVTHDYLLSESITVESSADYVTAEKNRILKAFSGENVNIF